MIVALWLLAIEGVIGAFDTLYYHEWRAQLSGRGALAASELKLHARWGLMTMAVGVLASGLRDLYAAYECPHGGWPWR